MAPSAIKLTRVTPASHIMRVRMRKLSMNFIDPALSKSITDQTANAGFAVWRRIGWILFRNVEDFFYYCE
jgi:hypothetical protein